MIINRCNSNANQYISIIYKPRIADKKQNEWQQYVYAHAWIFRGIWVSALVFLRKIHEIVCFFAKQTIS